MTKLFRSSRFFYLTLILIIFMLTAFPAAAFADDNEGSAENGQDTEAAGSASGTPDFSPPTSEAPASTNYTPADSPQDLPAPSDSDLSGAADINQPSVNPGDEPVNADPETGGNSPIDTASGQESAPLEAMGVDSNDSDSTVTADPAPVYFQVAEESMNPMLQPGDIVELVSTTYADGDLVVAQKADGTYVVKMLVGDQLVSLGSGTNYAVSEVTILGAVTLSAETQAALESSGMAWNSALAETSIQPEGIGTPDNPYKIARWENLYWLSKNSATWDKHFIQTNDIVFPNEIRDWDGGRGWKPLFDVDIGEDYYNNIVFSGVFNGNNLTISNLYINRPDEDLVGFFGWFAHKDNQLSNINLVDVEITGRNNVGGLVGTIFGGISNCSVSGSVTGTHNVGGLVGEIQGYAYAGTISDSHTNVSVSGINSGTCVGGLVGSSGENVTLSNSYATGDVTGNSYIGGLAGQNLGDIKNCYATGDITGTLDDGWGTGNTSFGGLIGENFFGTVENCFATGNVTGYDNVGGLVGSSYLSTIYDSYATGSVQGNDYVGGLVGLETSEATSATIYRSYATGTVAGQTYVGGLVGMLSGSSIYNSFAAGSVNGTSNVGRLVGSNVDGTIINSFAVLQGSHPLVGSGSAEGAGDTTIAAMKNSQTYIVAGWNIVGTGGAFPLLGWQVGSSSTWFMPGSRSDRGFIGDFNSTTLALPLQSSSVALTRIPGQNPGAVITPAFVTSGSAADLNRAIAAYNQAQQSYEANMGSMTPAEKAVAQTELAIANAAIKALELSLKAQAGQAFDMASLISAYNAAVAVLNANRALLTAEQIAEAKALLQAIATVISRYST